MTQAKQPTDLEDPHPFHAHLGARMVAWSQDYARFEQPIGPHLFNRHGIVHGGLHSVLLDTAMGYAGCWSPDPETRILAMTLSLTTNFLSVPGGDVLIAEGHKVGGGRSTYFASGTVMDASGKTIAMGTGAFRYRR